ncbi:MAG TPA: molybdate ABC transporter substrate-binding protein [Candidatus Limnocylindria bacterium]|nr:molybdate ABC transporter substrate-binding protein [Candidatus Limnocylindria bacterium]
MSPRSRLATAAAVLLVACQPSASVSPPSSDGAVEPVELSVFGAASLSDALAIIEEEYEGVVPGIDLVVATDSSTALRTQIEEGAPADVFLSADTANPDALVDAGLTEAAIEFAGNAITLVVPLMNPAEIVTPADLATTDVQVIGAGQEVPITRYVNEVVASLAALPDYPERFADAYAANVVSEEDNVRAVMTKVELGEGDAGFVYQTDAQASAQVLSIAIPDEANTHAVYAGCVIATSDRVLEAAAFLDWLAGADGQAILAESGFVAP